MSSQHALRDLQGDKEIVPHLLVHLHAHDNAVTSKNLIKVLV